MQVRAIDFTVRGMHDDCICDTTTYICIYKLRKIYDIALRSVSNAILIL